MLPMTIALVLFWGSTSAHPASPQSSPVQIKRLTHSGMGAALHPCLSHDGRKMLYTLEITEDGETFRAVRFIDLETGTERELFRDRTQTAPAPYERNALVLGAKPPIMSGDGSTAVFSLSVDDPVHIIDHYLAVAPTDGTGSWLTSFPISDLEGRDIRKLEFENGDWERVANYAVDRKGGRIACLVKGHLGPRRFGSASGIVLLDMQTKRQTTLIAPHFEDEEWRWTSSPLRPLSGGGWAFNMSADGRTIIFGAQNSNDPNDYDLYLTLWDDTSIRRLTDFHDRWFSLADITHDGGKIVFFYSGKKQQGLGTYEVDADGAGLRFVSSSAVPRIEFCEYSEDGRFLFYKNGYRIMRLDLVSGTETLVLSGTESDIVSDTVPLDFPQFPSFWMPNTVCFDGSAVLVAGSPSGKDGREIFLCLTDSK